METLKLGSTGTLVEYLQSILKTLGFYKGKIDGIFGSQTKSAVIIFQREFGITQDGIVGPNTWNKLSSFFYIVPTDISYGYNILSINLEGFTRKFPFLEQTNIGYSSLGKPLKALRFGRGTKQVFYSSSIHANEWITSVLLMKFLENLSTAYLNQSEIWGYPAVELFNKISLYIVPMVNPDGVDLVVGNTEKYQPDIYNYAKNLSNNYPSIPFPSGWKANINGIDFQKVNPIFSSVIIEQQQLQHFHFYFFRSTLVFSLLILTSTFLRFSYTAFLLEFIISLISINSSKF